MPDIYKFKLVRNKVPELFKRHHGYSPETLDPTIAEDWINKRYFAMEKLQEEIREVKAEARGIDKTDLNSLYEECADVIAAMQALLSLYDSDGFVKEKLKEATESKELKYGCMDNFRVVRITEEEKDHYYKTIKGKVENEF